MAVLAWLLVGLAVAGLLGRARPGLAALPAPVGEDLVPRYVLVWTGSTTPPELVPAPEAVFGTLPEAQASGARQILVLGPGVQPAADLPRRLLACGSDFVSVFPEPIGAATVEECWLRDFAGAGRVTDPTSAAGFADPRCVWLRATDLGLPGEGTEPLLRAARARKAHGLTVALRAGRDAHGVPLVEGPALTSGEWQAGLTDWLLGDPVLRALVGGLPVLVSLAAVFCLVWPETRATALLYFGLGAMARAWRTLESRFGAGLIVTGLWAEPALAARILADRRPAPPAEFPRVPTGPAPRLTGPQAALHGLDARLDASAVLHLARRLGGASLVMEQLYGNRPSGQTRFGRVVDRWVHASAGARALRHRCLSVAELGRALEPRSLLSVPGGSGRDAAAIGAPQTVLVDPDAVARSLAASLCPAAEIVNGTVETSPAGPFDLAIYVGLAEYLDDAEVVRHLVMLRARLDKTGALITSTTAPHPDQTFMAERLGWRTRARRHDAYAALLDAAGYRVELRSADPHGIQWVFLARPIGQRGSGPAPAVSGV